MQPVPCVDYIKATTIDHPRLSATPLAQLSHYVQTGTFHLRALQRLRSHRAGICYSRDLFALALLRAADPQRRWRLFYEAHTTPETPWSRRLARRLAARLDGIVTITESIRRYYLAARRPGRKVLTAPDGVDLARYRQLPDKADSTLALGAADRTSAHLLHRTTLSLEGRAHAHRRHGGAAGSRALPRRRRSRRTGRCAGAGA